MNEKQLMETYEFKNCGYKIVTCPVCGSKTLDSYWICDKCGWEYDGTLNKKEYSDCNHDTIEHYQETFQKGIEYV